MNNDQYSLCYKCSEPEKFIKVIGSKEVQVCVNGCKAEAELNKKPFVAADHKRDGVFFSK